MGLVNHGEFPKKRAPTRPLREPLRRGVQNVPWPTPLSGRGMQGTASVPKKSQFSRKQRLDARASIQVVAVDLASDGTRIIPKCVQGFCRLAAMDIRPHLLSLRRTLYGKYYQTQGYRLRQGARRRGPHGRRRSHRLRWWRRGFLYEAPRD